MFPTMRPAGRSFAPTLALSVLGLAVALAPRPAAARSLRDAAGPYQLQVLVEGAPARTFSHSGDTWVLGHLGARYTLRVINRSPERIEAVVSVDGRDVVDGRAGDYLGKRGYLVPAYGSVDIDGWRVSEAEAAAFRFSSVSSSYAARSGAPRDVGVIGVAVFPERRVWVPRPPRPIRPAPCCREDELGPQGGRGGEPFDADRSAAKASPPPASAAPAPSAESSSSSADGAARSGGSLARRSPEERPGLGTEFGEAVSSAVHEVEFTRQNPGRPSAVLGARYNDRAGLLALGIMVDPPSVASDGELRRSADPFPTEGRRYAPPPAGWTR